MAKGLIDLWLDSIFDADWIGRHGEKLTARELKLVKLLGRSGKILRNVYVPKEDGETSEIDVLFITQKGIYVIESKNFSGWIFGDEKAGYWTAMLPNKLKNKFYNPIKQNKTHMKWLEKYLDDDIPLFSLIVFSERCELKKITVESSDVRVIKRDRLYANVRDIWDHAEDKLDKEKVQAVYEKLKQLTHVSEAVKQAHVASINKKYKASEKPEISQNTQEALPDKIPEEAQAPKEPEVSEEFKALEKPEVPADVLICPRCGGKLVMRVAKRGANAGNSFYGCSNYPKCRYIQEGKEE